MGFVLDNFQAVTVVQERVQDGLDFLRVIEAA